ncbi:MAG: hypothetical protein QXU18_07590 [Thermoplasmatales archaeon]
MADSESEIIHPINAPVFHSVLKTISLPIEGGFGFNQVLSLIKTYPVLIPRLGDFARLEVKSDNVDELYSNLKRADSSVIVSKLHNYSESNRFVSWGSLYSVALPERIYSIYLEALDLFVSSVRPVFLKKRESRNGFVIKSQKFYLSINNDIYGYTESANVSLSSVLIRFTQYSIAAYQFKVSRDAVPLMSVHAEIGFFVNETLKFHEVTLAMTEEMLNFVKKNGLGVYACYVYSINDWIRGSNIKHELNLVVHMREIFYSPDSIFPFYGNFSHETPFACRSIVPDRVVEIALKELKRNTDYAMKDIDRISPLYNYQHKGGNFTFQILKPWVVFSLVTAYSTDITSKKSAEYVLTSEDPLEKVSEIVHSPSIYLPTSGNYIGEYVLKVVKEIRKFQPTKDQ